MLVSGPGFVAGVAVAIGMEIKSKTECYFLALRGYRDKGVMLM